MLKSPLDKLTYPAGCSASLRLIPVSPSGQVVAISVLPQGDGVHTVCSELAKQRVDRSLVYPFLIAIFLNVRG